MLNLNIMASFKGKIDDNAGYALVYPVSLRQASPTSPNMVKTRCDAKLHRDRWEMKKCWQCTFL